jgi:serine/threonine-protein kinase
LKEIGVLVHRDLKPANVLYHEGKWKIADFGIARFVEEATSTHTVKDFLSAQYAAPEQWKGEHATYATDIYAFSCIAHVLFRGEPPFPGPTTPDFQRQHISENPPQLEGVDPRLRAIFSAGLRKPQSGRPPIDRMLSVLSDVSKTSPEPGSGMAALQAVNAAEAERVSAATAEAERVRRKDEEQLALVQAGDRIFVDLIDRMRTAIAKNASEAKVHVSLPDRLYAAIGSALLHCALEGQIPPNVSFPATKWKVASMGRIHVHQAAPHEWEHGATLWYMERQLNPGYRWYEVSYRKSAFSGGHLIGPFAIQSIGEDIFRHADLAAGPGMHVFDVESGPTPIDDENMEEFLNRWLTRFAQVYQGRLRPF